MNKFFDKLAQKIVDRLIRRVGMDGVRVALVNVQPGDLIVVDIPDHMITNAEQTIIEREWSGLFTNNRVVVTNGFSISVIRGAPERPLGGRY